MAVPVVRGAVRSGDANLPDVVGPQAETGREVSVSTVETFRVADGKLVEQWVVMDALGLLQQLGAIPATT